MSSAEESPAQRQARLRRERREAKIKAGGADRLNRITGLSGRSPDVMNTDSPSPSASPIQTPSSSTPSIQTPTSSSGPRSQSSVPFPEMADQTPAQRQAQEEYLRALLRAPQTQSEQQQQQQGQGIGGSVPDDPMMRLMQSMLGGGAGGIPGLDPSAFGGLGGMGGSGPGTPGAPGQQQGSPPDMPDLSSTLAAATGLPPFLTDMFLGTKPPPPTPTAAKRIAQLKILHTVFALFVGVYLLLTYRRSVSLFGDNPPPPATVQNPLLWFFTGEGLIEATSAMLGTGDVYFQGNGNGNGREGSMSVIKKGVGMVRQVCADGGVVLFILGAGIWLMG